MGDVTDPNSWEDANSVTPPVDYINGAYQYLSQFVGAGPDTSMPFEYIGDVRAFVMGIPWQYVPGALDLGAWLNVSLNGGESWINNQIAPAGGGQTLTGTLHVDLNSSRLVLVKVARGPSYGATGSAAVTEPADTVAGVGHVSNIPGSGAIVEGADTVVGVGHDFPPGTGAVAEGADVVHGAGNSPGAGNAVEGADIVAGAGGTKDTGFGAAVEAGDIVAGSGTVIVSGSGAVSENHDISSGTGSDVTPGSFDVTVGTASGTGGVLYYGYSQGVFGSVSSLSLPPWATGVLECETDTGPGAGTYLTMSGVNVDPTSAAFSTLSVTIGGTTYNLSSSSAGYTYSPGLKTARWSWTSNLVFNSATPGNTYLVTLS